jgi:hypothetical protein
MLTLAAGNLSIRRRLAGNVAVLIDVSPSTRGAAYHDHAWRKRRLAELLQGTAYDEYAFAAGQPVRVSKQGPLPEIAADRTVFSPPPASAIVLFSDGQFSTPGSSAPVYAVIDPQLEQARDARIDGLAMQRSFVTADVSNAGPARRLSWNGASSPTTTVPSGSTLFRAERTGADVISAGLSPPDAWPENDSMSIRVSPPLASERWWIGTGPLPADWRAYLPKDLPNDIASYIAPSVIAINNVSADQLSDIQLANLRQYVEKLGGGLLIIGGDHAFAAGKYAGTALDALSPLASSPPKPTTHWILLLDSSGSMSAMVGERTRWQLAAAAMLAAMKSLPPADLASIGDFARELRWWSSGTSVSQVPSQVARAASIQPTGPTNLQAAIEQIAAAADPSVPAEVLLLTDAQADIDDPNHLAEALTARHIRLSILAVNDVPANAPIRQLVNRTGGAFVVESDAAKWSDAAGRILQASMPDRLLRARLKIQFMNSLSRLPGRAVELADQSWLKRDATELARAGDQPMSAQWSFGAGQVIACAFETKSNELYAMADLVAARPRDPRFTVTCSDERALRVSISAVDGNRFMNGLHLTAGVGDASPAPIPQVGPGEYSIELPSSKSPSFVTLRRDNTILDRIAVGGRYAAEFDRIGTNRQALSLLANRTAGAVIEPSDHRRIHLPDPTRQISMAPFLAVAAAICIAAGLICLRR